MHLFTTSSSPNGQRVAVFMKEKGVDIEKTEIDLRGGENTRQDFLDMAHLKRFHEEVTARDAFKQ